ncbi:MAG: MTH1187 family thiamine-binding protein [Armatimonadota bacterium]|nr:MTH1187 family thiamine-binding protein [Armatimonadota bacterium]MDR5697699.1 MTH1187 family thiamine-binding protein [Armatimonadota bacterium]
MEISVTPLGTPSPSVGEYVAAAVDVIRRSGLPYRVNPMGTTVEGDLEALLALVPRVHDAVFALGVARVSTLLKIDDRRDKPTCMHAKIASVEKHLR